MDFPKKLSKEDEEAGKPDVLIPAGCYSVVVAVDVRTTAPRNVPEVIPGRTPEITTERFTININVKEPSFAGDVRKTIEVELAIEYRRVEMPPAGPDEKKKFDFRLEAFYKTLAKENFSPHPKPPVHHE